MKQSGLKLEQGAEYRIRMKITSTESRTVKYAFLNKSYDWYGGQDLDLNAGEMKEVDDILKVEKDTDAAIDFVISMGKSADADIPTHAIEIDDISVIKLGGEGDDSSDDPTAGTDDGSDEAPEAPDTQSPNKPNDISDDTADAETEESAEQEDSDVQDDSEDEEDPDAQNDGEDGEASDD